ncbi:UDP-N-acetylglucosamine--N-acetylmuramyl-(pentapeptide) pyrophosphoryl-undecaprenol N-acetylglucosamine transferase [Fundidesulfovibrio magnetotacticus]|uniref:UDP-N-acetylglucosamine--N-acetylmuramyl-(pentapeptide) pyrophosphoryl-undecaprenol N-acetylglucosamine transferase n=1 Tax=Fundidesulfovibrio magnetotacticus TaxID=2730080 RepID=A0A6V8LSK1_9BACT|nr:undecaprenyldiphospho-muramoylpentapeptide beta-N-acetylglucosaminyltransferase [Fundidesulfovibrio magnetotacticus]GFK93551.1 UDP-N-acetylglucosamine--N-acetylmuramyl-(pentapeptide) pyrophosphoryl-undecaprenol N-acetylglucosamine transferase [Fundidesulfovibrio magnetotacticus]
MKRVLVATGGTGGHIFPALAVIEELRAMHPGLECLFVGGEGPEGRLAREAGVDFRGLAVRGVLGKGLSAVPAALRMGGSLLTALAVVREFRPQVAAGFGGYAGFCPVLAAWMQRIPTAVHEQNSVPGATNRLLGRVVRRVMVSYPDESGAFPPGKVLLTGNPVRPGIAGAIGTEAARVVPSRILVLGGSQGARAVNRVVVTAWPRLASQGFELRHQTGASDYESVRNLYRGQERVTVEPFIQDMPEAYAWADLVIGRAGASTLAEVACMGLPSVLVPFPHATHDHQAVNASYLERVGAAVVLKEKDLNTQTLEAAVLSILGDPEKCRAMGRAARTQAKPHAARDIAMELSRLAA